MRALISILIALTSHQLVAQDSLQVLGAEAISRLMPSSIKGLSNASDTKAKLITLGDMKYAMAEKTFGVGRKSIRLMLFDYGAAPVMLLQTRRSWSGYVAVSSDSLVRRPYSHPYYTGWETTTPTDTQIVLIVHDRYVLVAGSQHAGQEGVMDAIRQVDFKKFPH
ncbi:MAG: hypothetical protein HC859_04915 [Bacteroidia bacterium]|nr:hypothetical protein [Bacteroidia bacterium]